MVQPIRTTYINNITGERIYSAWPPSGEGWVALYADTPNRGVVGSFIDWCIKYVKEKVKALKAKFEGR